MRYLASQDRWPPAHALDFDRMLDHVLPSLTSSNTPRRQNKWLHHRYFILADCYDGPLQIWIG
jgi:hypothetical protein